MKIGNSDGEFVEIDEKKYRIEDLSHDTRNLLFQLQNVEANLNTTI